MRYIYGGNAAPDISADNHNRGDEYSNWQFSTKILFCLPADAFVPLSRSWNGISSNHRLSFEKTSFGQERTQFGVGLILLSET